MSVENLFKEGYTIIPSLISEDACDKLKTYLDHNFTKNLPYNYSDGHYQINLPNHLDNFPEEMVFNEEIHTVLKETFGKNYYMHSYCSS